MSRLNKKFILITSLVLSVLLLYFNWTSWHNFLIGAIALILYFAIGSYGWGGVVEKILPVSKRWSIIFGFLVSFYLISFAIGIPIVLWKYHRPTIAIILFLVGLIGLILGGKHKFNKNDIASAPEKERLLSTFLGINLSKKILLAGFAFLSALFIFLLFHARAGVYILSPWDAISSFTLILFFGLCFALVLF